MTSADLSVLAPRVGRALAVAVDGVWVGATFSSAGLVPSLNLARWDHGVDVDPGPAPGPGPDAGSDAGSGSAGDPGGCGAR